MKTKSINELNFSEKIISTWDYESGVLEEIRKQVMKIVNIQHAYTRIVLKFQAKENRHYPERDLSNLNNNINNERELLFKLMQGLSEIMRTNKRLRGIIPHGKQLSLFEPLFIEIGEEPSATHKGGTANAK